MTNPTLRDCYDGLLVLDAFTDHFLDDGRLAEIDYTALREMAENPGARGPSLSQQIGAHLLGAWMMNSYSTMDGVCDREIAYLLTEALALLRERDPSDTLPGIDEPTDTGVQWMRVTQDEEAPVSEKTTYRITAREVIDHQFDVDLSAEDALRLADIRRHPHPYWTLGNEVYEMIQAAERIGGPGCTTSRQQVTEAEYSPEPDPVPRFDLPEHYVVDDEAEDLVPDARLKAEAKQRRAQRDSPEPMIVVRRPETPKED